MAELARAFPGVHTDLSLRLPEMLRGSCTPEDFAAHLRRIGTDRVLYGTNFGFVDTLTPDPSRRPAGDPQVTWAKRTLEAFLDLPLREDERAAIAAGNWDRLTGSGLAYRATAGGEGLDRADVGHTGANRGRRSDLVGQLALQDLERGDALSAARLRSHRGQGPPGRRHAATAASALLHGELAVHPGGVVARQVADQLVAARRQVQGDPA